MSNDQEEMINAGDLRPSQLLTYSGPGSIVNTRYDAVMIYGCNVWPQEEKKRYKILHHELLQQKLNISSIRMPLSHDRSFNIPCFSFPTWSVCENCQTLQKHPTSPKNSMGFVCWYCEKNGVKKEDCRLTHARFAVICKKGHIDEFPWEEWVHHDKPNNKCEKKPGSPLMKFAARQESSALKDYAITCLSCHNAYRTCSGATDIRPLQALNITCTGRSPWLHQHTDDCVTNGEKTFVKGIQIRSNTLWYSLTMSALKVPKWLHPVNLKLEDEKDANRLYGSIQLDRQDGKSFEEIYDYHKGKFKEVAEQILEQKKKNSDPNCSDEQIKDEIIKKLQEIFEGDSTNTEIPDQIDILQQEYDDFIRTESTKGTPYEDEFELETSEIDKNRPLYKHLNSLKQIKKISTVSVLRGFTRGEPPDPLDPDIDKLCKITTNKHHKTYRWFPGVITKGEGIFFSFDNEKLSEWERNTTVQKRCNAIIESYAYHSAPDEPEKQKEIMMRFNPRFLLLHTLSHLIIKTVSMLSGYNEPSLQERIYWDNKDRNGILIYTSGSSEGSLGGLVRLGKADQFERILKDALQRSLTCSRDPICNDSDPIRDSKSYQLSKTHQLSGSSCHSCCIVAETSCMFFNQFLDRWMIKDEDGGFFTDFLNEQSN